MQLSDSSPLQILLDQFRAVSHTPRELGTYFEELTVCFFRNEPAYKELYREVVPYAQWAERQGFDKRDVGIDLVAVTATSDVHAIQCKLYPTDYRLKKGDIDSFFTASGKEPFTHRVIVSTVDEWSEHADGALHGQQIPVTKIDLSVLENSVLDWTRFSPRKPPVLKDKNPVRQHQNDAISAVVSGLQVNSRGKLIMACGTGKTFTSLKIAEVLAGVGRRVLFLVPSLALLSQALTEWTQQSSLRLQSFAVCSDSDVGKRRTREDDVVQTFAHELQYPATTSAQRLAWEVGKRQDLEHMSVVFATYHSINVVREAQRDHGLSAFDLIICDEAHRTTGATLEGESESHFVRIHDADFIQGHRRLYMTATPKIFADSAKATAERDNIAICSMDDDKLYGPYLHILTFSEAVKRGLLVDYKVIVLSIEESHVSRRIQNLLKDENNELRVDDAAKIIGCWKALSKHGLAEAKAGDTAPMKRAVAFCQVIRAKPGTRTHKVASVDIATMFQAVVEAYQETDTNEDAGIYLRCEADHVDGSMNATQKTAKIEWLKSETPDNCCRILSNVRCLSEGVDVPALDAVLFLTPRNSQVDVVQSVGRVMRTAPKSGKTRGYIILPVVIPAGVEAHDALNDNQTYKVVWQVLQALRSHDDRFDAMVNKLDLIGKDPSKLEVIAITDKIQRRKAAGKGDPKKEAAKHLAKAGRTIGAKHNASSASGQMELQFEIGEIERAIYAKLVDKVGNRHHWEDWAKDIARIARTHIDRITAILNNPDSKRERSAFEQFSHELRDDLNDSLTRDEIIEMLAQHVVTKPVFGALFTGSSFVAENSMSRAMQGVLDILEEHRLEKEASTLQAFYESVKLRAEGIESFDGRQKIVVELYDKFFRSAFPRMSERLGIVYTPIEVVDFILKSVDDLLRAEFGQTLGSEGVHILDPFTGTGTFITRLLHSGLIKPEELPRKYANEIHANEIVLLAYYIAAINIEAAYHGMIDSPYAPFNGICFTDTFQMYEKDDLVSQILFDNSARRVRQKELDIRVIIGNPPYSVGQDSENDNNANVEYPRLDKRIAATYVARSQGKLAKGLYDSYVRAIRWASDRIGESGILGFVTNANFIEASTADGLRKCLIEEYSSLYIFHLRGNARTSGERRRREGGNAFGAGSRAPVAISLLVKNPAAKQRGLIFFRDIGDCLTQQQKLDAVAELGSVAGIDSVDGWTQITPDVHGDWLKQRDDSFAMHFPLGAKDKADSSDRLFSKFSLGVFTSRDAWVCSPSARAVAEQVQRLIAAYQAELARFNSAHLGSSKKERGALLENFVDTDPTRINWSRALKNEFAKGSELKYDAACIVPSLYRPFSKQWLYFDRKLNEMVYQMPRLFPHPGVDNLVIGVSASESRSGYSVLMANAVPSLHATDMVGSQYFPLYVYEETGSDSDDTEHSRSFSPTNNCGIKRRDGITDAGLAHFQAMDLTRTVTKEDVFYYVYGLLHSPEYRLRYADNLGKELPRVPRVSAADFWAFSEAGRALSFLHVSFDQVPEYAARVDFPAKPLLSHYRVERMKFGKGKDKTVIHYNEFITVRDIPIEAYGYVVNGKSAIEWVMERQTVAVDKASGIVRDANGWATETIGDVRYPLSLLLRVITVSLETLKIISGLPALNPLVDEPKEQPSNILPFRVVSPAPGDRYRNCIPLIPLNAAAGSWSDEQQDLPQFNDPGVEWITWNSRVRFATGMFVARVQGRSMEPKIPDGAYCLFRIVPLPSAPDRPVLVRHGGVIDPETGGHFTVKFYREEIIDGRKRILLEPANTAFEALIVTPAEAHTVRVIAEVVEVLPNSQLESVKLPGALPLWFFTALSLESEGREHEALDLVYWEVDELLCRGDFEACNNLFIQLAPEGVTLDIALGLLTITLAASSLLPARQVFFDKLEEKLRAERDDFASLLAGLRDYV